MMPCKDMIVGYVSELFIFLSQRDDQYFLSFTNKEIYHQLIVSLIMIIRSIITGVNINLGVASITTSRQSAVTLSNISMHVPAKTWNDL